MSTKSKIILITGASSGIGAACSKRFALAGFEVWMLARDEKKLKHCAQAIEAKKAGCLRLFPIDLCDAAQLTAFWTDRVKENSLPDVLVNNAGEFIAKPVLKIQREEAQRLFELNLMVPWEMLVSAAKLSIEKQRQLSVLNVLSVTALQSYPACGMYGASKAALKSLMESARSELRAKGVRITNILPGAVDTPIWDGFGMNTEVMMDPDEVASVIFHACEAHPRTLVEDIVLRPTSGDF